MTDKITELIAKARTGLVRDWGGAYGLMERLADALEETVKEMHARELHHFEEEKLRAEAEDLLSRVAGVAASSIPDLSLREKPMAAVVDLAATLSAAEAERDALRAAIQEAMDHENSCFGESDTWRILSRAIDTKEGSNG